MGSLMAGWDSPVLGDDTKARVMRNRSLTKEEVAAFWRQREKPASEGGGGETAVTSPLASPGRPMYYTLPNKTSVSLTLAYVVGSSPRSRSPASSLVARGHDEIDAADAAAAAAKRRDWWTRSPWAFLNEPQREEAPGTAHSYTPQFPVAAGRIVTGNA